MAFLISFEKKLIEKPIKHKIKNTAETKQTSTTKKRAPPPPPPPPPTPPPPITTTTITTLRWAP